MRYALALLCLLTGVAPGCDSEDSSTAEPETPSLEPYLRWCAGLKTAVSGVETCEPLLEAITAYTTVHQEELKRLRAQQKELPESEDEALDGALQPCFEVVVQARAACPDTEPLWEALKRF